MSAAYSVRNAQYHVYSFWHRLVSAMTAIICGASTFHVEFAFGAGSKDVASTVSIVAWDADVRHVDSDFIRFSLPPYQP